MKVLIFVFISIATFATTTLASEKENTPDLTSEQIRLLIDNQYGLEFTLNDLVKIQQAKIKSSNEAMDLTSAATCNYACAIPQICGWRYLAVDLNGDHTNCPPYCC